MESNSNAIERIEAKIDSTLDAITALLNKK